VAPADPRRALAERVRRALIERAQAAHEDAGIRGLCCEGAWEAVVSALRTYDLDDVLGDATPPPRDASG
jgi:hypothetical protein